MTANAERQAEKRDRILAAAKILFLRNGLRATTMEAIARAAQIAKPTLYAHFSDKQAVFEGLLAQLVIEKHAAFDAALARDGSVIERIGRVLIAKFGVISLTVAGSAHAEELFAAHHLGADLFAKSDAEIAAKLTAHLVEAGAENADHLTWLLLAAAKGVAEAGLMQSGLKRDLQLLTDRLVRPALPG